MMQNENKSDHHCHLYEGKNNILIVRRAQEFQMTLQFNQPINPSDKFQIEFYIGKTNLGVPPDSPNFSPSVSQTGNWTGRMIQQQEDECVVGITPSANAIIGKYYTNVAVIGSNGISRTQRDSGTDFYLLFNAWASMYMPSEEDRQEYVMNENGCMYQEESGGGRQWFYGQFVEGILDVCIQILDDSNMPLVNRGDAVKVCRIGSAMMNSQDDRGVLVGNWSDEYSLGTAPTFWIGSDQILLQYANKGPVSYAQCWVYAGTFNTFLRCLGIPARVITNFNSAHDNTGNIITDLVFNSIVFVRGVHCLHRNYHCWNEAYLSRLDLPADQDLGGWQVVDSTPQETSDGYYRCGPCSVKAIKEGMLGYQFDGPFVFAEVNSDVYKHKLNRQTGKTELLSVDTTYVGKKLLTKSIGGNNYEPMDITETYKYPEGISKDEETMKKAERTYKTHMQYDDEQGVEMTLEIPLERVKIGQNFQMAVVFRNLSEDTRTIHGFLVGSTVYYTNIQRAQFKQESFDVTLNPMESEVQVVVLAQNYMPQLGSQSNLRFVVTAKSMENNQDMTAIQIVNLKGPELAFAMSGPAKVNQEVFIKVEFTNPFPFSLHNVRMAMQGANFMLYREKLYSEIATGASITWMESCVPTRSGNTMIYAVLDCSVLGNVQGVWAIGIQT
uniref:Coagulation factor XIII A chain n=1 Tax=Hucho hucho TaxID=62062 RepID=A0A4W5L5C7_9TELE